MEASPGAVSPEHPECRSALLHALFNEQQVHWSAVKLANDTPSRWEGIGVDPSSLTSILENYSWVGPRAPNGWHRRR